jgi:hypothetical protein
MFSDDRSAGISGRPGRILGMKIWQIGLLGGMGLLDCLVLAAGVAIVIGSVSSRSAGPAAVENPAAEAAYLTAAVTMPTVDASTPAVDASTPTVESSPTLEILFPTYTPFGTPADSPTPTITATSSMEGWVKYSVREVEMWMPGSYAAGNPHTDAKAIIASLRDKGASFNFDAIDKNLTTSEKNYILWGIDSIQGDPSIVTNVAVLYDYPHPGETLADYTTRFISEMSETFILVEQSKINSPVYEIERTMLETKNPQTTTTRIVLYAVRDQNIIWDVLCITAADEMETRLPAFDLMVDTLRVLAAPQ